MAPLPLLRTFLPSPVIISKIQAQLLQHVISEVITIPKSNFSESPSAVPLPLATTPTFCPRDDSYPPTIPNPQDTTVPTSSSSPNLQTYPTHFVIDTSGSSNGPLAGIVIGAIAALLFMFFAAFIFLALTPCRLPRLSFRRKDKERGVLPQSRIDSTQVYELTTNTNSTNGIATRTTIKDDNINVAVVDFGRDEIPPPFCPKKKLIPKPNISPFEVAFPGDQDLDLEINGNRKGGKKKRMITWSEFLAEEYPHILGRDNMKTGDGVGWPLWNGNVREGRSGEEDRW